MKRQCLQYGVFLLVLSVVSIAGAVDWTGEDGDLVRVRSSASSMMASKASTQVLALAMSP